jgi:hypothetical protein
MVESETHKFIKKKIAESLKELGYNVETEIKYGKGRIDVLAEKEGNFVKVEVYNSHISDWVVAEINGEITEVETRHIESLEDQFNRMSNISKAILSAEQFKIFQRLYYYYVVLDGIKILYGPDMARFCVEKIPFYQQMYPEHNVQLFKKPNAIIDIIEARRLSASKPSNTSDKIIGSE